MVSEFLEYGLYLALVVFLAIPLGTYTSKVMQGERCLLTPIVSPVERLIWRMLLIDPDEEMHWAKYAASAVTLTLMGAVSLFLLVLCQGFLPLNQAQIPGMDWDLALNTAISFVTTTNWQNYAGESETTYLTQMLGFTVQNFVATAISLSVLFAVIRGFSRVESFGLGSFWVDSVRSVLYILLPLSFVLAIGLASQGVVQSLNSYEVVQLLDPTQLTDEFGDPVTDATGSSVLVTQAVVPQGQAASQVAIKQLGTAGGGFFGANAAHPFENPTPFSNLLEITAMLLLPIASCFAFGREIGEMRQGRSLFSAMLVMLALSLVGIAIAESFSTVEAYSGSYAAGVSGTESVAIDDTLGQSQIGEAQAGGNMEGKETRFGVTGSASWAAVSTASSNGSVNSMLDSYTPLGGMIPLILIQLGEVAAFGGVGSGLHGMLSFAIVTAFVAGLMIGRQPEYLGKRLNPREIKLAMGVVMTTPMTILAAAGLAALFPETTEAMHNEGVHGFSEFLFAFSSVGSTNGSAFAGFDADTPLFNVFMGLVMLAARFVPLLCALAFAGSLVTKKKVPRTVGSLPTDSWLFVGLLNLVVIFIGAMGFFPSLALGPIAEFFESLG